MKNISLAAIILALLFALSACVGENYFYDIAEHFSGGKYRREAEEDIDLYSYIENELINGNVEFVLKNVSGEDVFDVYKDVLGNHPELFWLGVGYSYETVTSRQKTTVTFECVHTDLEGLNEKKAAFESVVNSIVSEAEKRGSDYEKVLYVHDYIIDNTDYDQRIYDLLVSDDSPKTVYDASSAYGCLVNHSAICSGYAAAFQYIMQRLGIECGRVTGKKIGEGPHEWNYVFLDDAYYYIDVTWDDPVIDGTGGNKTYQFFCITTDELLETHEIDDNRFVPECTLNKYNYYVYNNLYMSYYDYGAFSEIYNNHMYDAKICVKFSNSDELHAAVNDLVEKQKIFEIANGKRRCTYSVGVGGRVLELIME